MVSKKMEDARAALDDAVADAIDILKDGYTENPKIDRNLVRYPHARYLANSRFYPEYNEEDGRSICTDPIIGEAWSDFTIFEDSVDVEDGEEVLREIERNADILRVPYGPEYKQLKLIVERRGVQNALDYIKPLNKNKFEPDYRKALRTVPLQRKAKRLDLEWHYRLESKEFIDLLIAGLEDNLRLAARAITNDKLDLARWYLTSASAFSGEIASRLPLNFTYYPQEHLRYEFKDHIPQELDRIVEYLEETHHDYHGYRTEKIDVEGVTEKLRCIALERVEGRRSEIAELFKMAHLNLEEGEEFIKVSSLEQLQKIMDDGCTCSTLEPGSRHRFVGVRRDENILILICKGDMNLNTSDSKVVELNFSVGEKEIKALSEEMVAFKKGIPPHDTLSEIQRTLWRERSDALIRRMVLLSHLTERSFNIDFPGFCGYCLADVPMHIKERTLFTSCSPCATMIADSAD